MLSCDRIARFWISEVIARKLPDRQFLQQKRLKLTPCLSFPRGLKILSHIRNTRNYLFLRTYFNLKSNQNLFTQAIQSSPEGRLTLAQIYDWMIASVPYFTQRADSTSSAGWKVTQHFLQTFNFTSIFLQTLTLTFSFLQTFTFALIWFLNWRHLDHCRTPYDTTCRCTSGSSRCRTKTNLILLIIHY